MLYVLPIEPLEERYSEQWLEWTRRFLYDNSIPYFIISPPAYQTITSGAFLDVVGTNIYKNNQMCVILKLFQEGKIKDGDIFWVHDAWFPGLETLAYIRDGSGIDFKIYGMLHAGTYDPNDFLTKKGMRKWGKYAESCWFNVLDGIFVATKYHKKLIKQNSTGIPAKRIHVTGFPMYDTAFASHQRKPHDRDKVIVFPHRLNAEKQPLLFDQLKQEMLEKYPWSREYQFIKTKYACKTKEQYYALLRRAEYAVSFALQETWGIAMQEAALCGCHPIVPNRLSYSEMYPAVYKYMPERWDSNDVLAASSWLDYVHSHPDMAHAYLSELQLELRKSGKHAFGNMMWIMEVK